jgi:prepilin-type N-terminal cleavage/methylation domain-containing protein
MIRIFGRRRAFTMTELLVVVAISAIVLALIVVTVVRVREAAARTESQNKLRQIMLGMQHFASASNGRLPAFDPTPANANLAPFLAVLPFVDQGAFDLYWNREMFPPNLALFISPADPTAANGGLLEGCGICSYAANGQIFIGQPVLPASIPDGTSNTIGIAEHYAYMCGLGAVTGDGVNFPYLTAQWGVTFSYWDTTTPGRATFADVLQGYVPYTSGDPPVSVAATYSPPPGPTFQTAPTQAACYSGLAQTPHPSGMLVAMMDGSVRIISPSISESNFWGAVTPAGGETIDLD